MFQEIHEVNEAKGPMVFSGNPAVDSNLWWVWVKFFDLGRVGSIFCGSGRVRSAIFGLGLGLENFP